MHKSVTSIQSLEPKLFFLIAGFYTSHLEWLKNKSTAGKVNELSYDVEIVKVSLCLRLTLNSDFTPKLRMQGTVQRQDVHSTIEELQKHNTDII